MNLEMRILPQDDELVRVRTSFLSEEHSETCDIDDTLIEVRFGKEGDPFNITARRLFWMESRLKRLMEANPGTLEKQQLSEERDA